MKLVNLESVLIHSIVPDRESSKRPKFTAIHRGFQRGFTLELLVKRDQPLMSWCNRRCNANDATEQRETWNRRRGGGRAEWRSERCGFSRGQSVLIAYSGHLTNCLDCLSDVMAGLMKRRPCSMLFNGLNGGIRG